MGLNGLMKSNSMAIDLRWCERAVCQGLAAEKMKECVWVRPEVVAEIQFLEWTPAKEAHFHAFVEQHPRDFGLRIRFTRCRAASLKLSPQRIPR